MKPSKILVILFTITLLSGNAYAFTAYYEQTISGTGIPASQSQVVRIKDDKIRMEMDSPQGRTVTIISGKTMYSYVPSKNTAVKFTNKGAPNMSVLSDYRSYLTSLDAKAIGSGRVAPYNCDIYEFTDPRTKLMSKVWLWKEKDFPVKVETKTQDGLITTIMENVKIGGDIADSEFALPSDVEIINAEDFMSQ